MIDGDFIILFGQIRADKKGLGVSYLADVPLSDHGERSKKLPISEKEHRLPRRSSRRRHPVKCVTLAQTPEDVTSFINDGHGKLDPMDTSCVDRLSLEFVWRFTSRRRLVQ